MYGTIAEMRVRLGKNDNLIAQLEELRNETVAGADALYLYRMDAEPARYYMVVVFESKEAYWANATSPEQDVRYRKLLPLLESPPQWHDGEIACLVEFAYSGL